jgi:hypothetical protein
MNGAASRISASGSQRGGQAPTEAPKASNPSAQFARVWHGLERMAGSPSVVEPADGGP